MVMSLVILVFSWSINEGQQRIGAAKNDCERACIGDSGVSINVARFAFITRTATHERSAVIHPPGSTLAIGRSRIPISASLDSISQLS